MYDEEYRDSVNQFIPERRYEMGNVNLERRGLIVRVVFWGALVIAGFLIQHFYEKSLPPVKPRMNQHSFVEHQKNVGRGGPNHAKACST